MQAEILTIRERLVKAKRYICEANHEIERAERELEEEEIDEATDWLDEAKRDLYSAAWQVEKASEKE